MVDGLRVEPAIGDHPGGYIPPGAAAGRLRDALWDGQDTPGYALRMGALWKPQNTLPGYSQGAQGKAASPRGFIAPPRAPWSDEARLCGGLPLRIPQGTPGGYPRGTP